MVAVAVLGAGIGDELHAPRALVVVRRLGGVADDEHDGVPPGDGERVVRLVVLHEPDELLELLEVEVGLALLVGQVNLHVSGHEPESRKAGPSGQQNPLKVGSVHKMLVVCR